MELRSLEVPDILGNDRRGTSRDGKLDYVIVPLVAQVGPPSIVDVRPAADAEKSVEQGISLASVEPAGFEEGLSGQQRFIFRKESRAHQRLELTFQARTQNRAAGTRRAQ